MSLYERTKELALSKTIRIYETSEEAEFGEKASHGAMDATIKYYSDLKHILDNCVEENEIRSALADMHEEYDCIVSTKYAINTFNEETKYASNYCNEMAQFVAEIQKLLSEKENAD